jgi:hypothetical protein
MWHPEFDTVMFEKHPFHNKTGAFDLFELQFPQQMNEVQSIAVKSTLWDWDAQYKTAIYAPLPLFAQLKEFIVVVEESYEHWCSSLKVYFLGACNNTWSLPRDIECSMKAFKESAKHGDWCVPRVRIVRFQEDIVTPIGLKIETRNISELLRVVA